MRTALRVLRCVVLAVAVPTGCTSGVVGPPPQPPVDWHAFDVHRVLDGGPSGPTAKERAVAETYAAAIASPGFVQLAPILDPWAHFAFPGASDARGRDAVVHAHEALLGAFDSRVIAMNRVWRTENAQAVEWTLTGVQARAWMGLPATQRMASVKGLTLLWTKDDGSITDVHLYFHVAAVKLQLGASSRAALTSSPSSNLLAVSAGSAAPARSAVPAVSTGSAISLAPSHGSTPPQIFDQTGSPDEQRNAAVVRSALDALEGTSDAAYLATMADDVEVIPIGHEPPMRGKGDLSAYFKSIHKAIGQLDTTIDNAWGVEKFAVVEYLIAGEQLGTIDGVPPHRDRVVRLHVVDVAEFSDGKIARIWRYDNPSEIAVSPLGE
jgi:ketosteroid isomerase-like protein